MTSKLRPAHGCAMDAMGKSAPKMDQSFTWKKKTTTVPVGIWCLPSIYIDLPCQTKKKNCERLIIHLVQFLIDSHRFSNRYVEPSKKKYKLIYINIYKSTIDSHMNHPKSSRCRCFSFNRPRTRKVILSPSMRGCSWSNLSSESLKSECFGICDFQKNIKNIWLYLVDKSIKTSIWLQKHEYMI